MSVSRVDMIGRDDGTGLLASSGKGHDEDITPSIVWNKSCVACTRRKRKCDGLRPCSRCLRKNEESTCTYLKRKLHKPHKPHMPKWDSSNRKTTFASGAVRDTREITINNGGYTGAIWPHWPYFEAPNKLKRCKLGVSPATGLVGMQESHFLNNFFDYLGLMPLTTQSEIRETMVRIMSVTKNPKRVADSCDFNQEDEGSPWLSPEKFDLKEALLSDDDCSASAPSTCAFWSAVALGALLAGQPTESVTRYVFLAKDAMKRYKGSSTTELIRMWILTAQVDGFFGDSEGFQQGIRCAKTLIHDSKQRGKYQELPLWLIETTKKDTTVKLMKEYNSADAESFCREDITLGPKINIGSTDEDVYIFVVRIHKKLEQALHGCCKTGGSQDSPKVQFESDGKVLDPLGVDLSAMEKLRNKLPLVEPLELLQRKPSIRIGLGGLIISMTLAVAKAVNRDDGGVLEHLRTAVGVFDRYPGILRFVMGLHDAHRVLAALVAQTDPEARALYQTMRTVYNQMHPSSSSPIPPFEEWQGVHVFCSNPVCRVAEAIFRPPIRSHQCINTAGNAAAAESCGASCEYDISVAGNHDRGGGEGRVDTLPLSGWSDIYRRSTYGKCKDAHFPAQGGVNPDVVPSSPIALGDGTHLATLEASENNSSSSGAKSTFGVSGSGCDSYYNSSHKCLVVGGNGTVKIAPPQVRIGEMEDQALMMMVVESHKETRVDSSFIRANSSCVDDYVDISPEDWLQVANDALSPTNS